MDDPQPPTPPADEPKRVTSLWETAAMVAAALAVTVVVQAVLLKPFRIPSESMVPTLKIGHRVIVDRLSYHLVDPKRGDVAVFLPPAGAEDPVTTCGTVPAAGQACPKSTPAKSDQPFIKRIVAVPGDRLKVVDGRAYINGRRQREPFISPDATCDTCQLPREITIPKDSYFMMGDNRGGSADSRLWGPVPRDQLIGKARLRYWPPGRIGTL